MRSHLRFTVIIACYETEPYLPKALASVSNQSFADFEALCYVEESSDCSLTICQDFAVRDPRFKVATGPKSGGVGASRNYGIDHAVGEYLVVLDGDDWIVPDMLEKLDAKLRDSGDVDVLSFAAVSTESEDVDLDHAEKMTNFRPGDADGVFSGIEAIRRTGRNCGRMCNHTVLSIYRTCFLRDNHLYQTSGLVMEDFESTPRIWFLAKRFAYLDEIFYIYRRRAGSLTTQSSPRLVQDLARQLVSLMDFAAHNEIPEDILRIWSNQWLAVFFWFMFHPVSSLKIPDTERRRALSIIFSGNGRGWFRRLAARATLPRKVAIPLICLATVGWQFPAKFYFRKIYYPLIERRQSKQRAS